MIRRGEVYWVSLAPTVGAEINKTRPAVVVSNDIGNAHAATVTILPLTRSVRKVFPFEVLIRAGTFGKNEACKVKTDHIRGVDKRRLKKLIGFLPGFLMLEIDAAMRLHLAL